MIKYIVVWIIATYTIAPTPPPTPDKFGRMSDQTTLSILRYNVSHDTLTKIFDDKSKAEKFYTEAKDQIESDSTSQRYGIRVNSPIVSVGMSEIKFIK